MTETKNSKFPTEADVVIVGVGGIVGSMLAYGIICHVFGWYMIILALKTVTATTAGIILISQPIFSLFWDYLFFSRHTTSIEIIGIAVVIIAMIICVSSESYDEIRGSN